MPPPSSPTPPELLKSKLKPDVVELPTRLVIALSGEGGPESEAFAAAIGALFGIGYTLKFTRKKAGGEDRKVGTLEGDWGVVGNHPTVGVPPRDQWRWQLRIAVPDDTTDVELQTAINAAITKKKGALFGSSVAETVQLIRLPAGRFGRILHRGAFASEPASFATLQAFLDAEGLTRAPGHIEVYFSDFRRTAEEKLKTTLLVRLV